MGDGGWAIRTVVALLGGLSLLSMWLNRDRPFKVCLDDYREIMCEYLTAEEYDEHLKEQRRIDAHILQRQCNRELNPRCV